MRISTLWIAYRMWNFIYLTVRINLVYELIANWILFDVNLILWETHSLLSNSFFLWLWTKLHSYCPLSRRIVCGFFFSFTFSTFGTWSNYCFSTTTFPWRTGGRLKLYFRVKSKNEDNVNSSSAKWILITSSHPRLIEKCYEGFKKMNWNIDADLCRYIRDSLNI